MRKTDLIKKLKKMFPGISGITCGDTWNGRRPEKYGAIHLGDVAEGGEIDGLPAANYYAWESDPEEKIYVLGVHKKLREVLEDNGYYPEWNDAGTLLAYSG